jgi:hypothetical protein
MPFGSLWLPVVVSAVAVWLVSAILHMVFKYHKADYKPLSEEAAVAQALRAAGPAPGIYPVPYCPDPSQMKDPAIRKRYEDGPVAMITVMPNGVPAMPKYLGLWFLVCFLVSLVTAYVARHTLSYATDGLEVFRLTGTLAFLGYGFGSLQDSIWKGEPWSNTLRNLIDAGVYALVTGLIFRLLWPAS